MVFVQEKKTACDSLAERQQSCQDSLAQVRAELAHCQAEAAKRSAAAAVVEATLQQALSAAEADYKSSIQASHASVPDQSEHKVVGLTVLKVVWEMSWRPLTCL